MSRQHPFFLFFFFSTFFPLLQDGSVRRRLIFRGRSGHHRSAAAGADAWLLLLLQIDLPLPDLLTDPPSRLGIVCAACCSRQQDAPAAGDMTVPRSRQQLLQKGARRAQQGNSFKTILMQCVVPYYCNLIRTEKFFFVCFFNNFIKV